MWLKQLKIALIEKDITKIEKLMDSVPELTNQQEIEEALFLIKASSDLVSSLKDKASSSMQQLKKNSNFLKSTQAPQKNKFDIKY